MRRPPNYSSGDQWNPLSNYDALCLLTTRRFNYVCVANDQNLRKACERVGVALKWGLQIVVELFIEGAISYERAKKIGERIFQTNPWISRSVFERFLEKIDRGK